MIKLTFTGSIVQLTLNFSMVVSRAQFHVLQLACNNIFLREYSIVPSAIKSSPHPLEESKNMSECKKFLQGTVSQLDHVRSYSIQESTKS